MKAIWLLLLMGLCISCNDQNGSNGEQPDGEGQQPVSTVSYLALGDSYTIGEGVDEDQRWPNLLAGELSNDTLQIEPVRIVAQTGWTTGDLLEGIARAQLNPPYNVVSLLIGVNNQYQGQDPAIYKQEFDELLQKAIAFAGGKRHQVFVLSIPDYSVTPFAASRDTTLIRREINQYNAVADSICGVYGIPFYNITPISREARTDRTLLASDNLHPSGRQYALWVEAIRQDVAPLFGVKVD
jgi:lysophospholipase L1-like esterase